VRVLDGIAYTFGRQRGGVMTLTYRDAERVDTRRDSLAFGLTTDQRDAVVVHVVSANSNDYISIELVCVRQLPASADSVTLLAFAARTPCCCGARRYRPRAAALLQRSIDGTDRRTEDGRTAYRYIDPAAYFSSSVNK